MVFVNREVELADLRELLQAGSGQLALLYGRRRLGKTALLQQLTQTEGGLYFQIPDQAEAGILHHLNARLRQHTGRPIEYTTIADFLGDLGTHGERLVILDEAQRLFEGVSGSASLLQEAWDHTLKKQAIALVLCGSVIGTLQALLDAKSPLYGRITYNHHLAPFSYGAVRQFYPKLNETERLQRYAVLGATPHYHDINLDRPDLKTAITKSFLNASAPLKEEPRTLFAIELQRPERYQEILEAMGRGAQTLGEVAQYYGRKASDYTAYFNALRDRLRIVQDADPIGGKKRRKRIGFTDPFFRFYYRHIYPNMDRIELGDAAGVMADIEADLPNLVGRVWEDVCRQWMISMQGKTHAGHTIRFRQIGSWWDGPDEIDVVALGDNVVYCGECKYRTKAMTKAELETFVERAKKVQAATGAKELRLFVWVKGGLGASARAFAEAREILVLGVEDVVGELGVHHILPE